MSELQKRSINHVIGLLESIDSYDIYQQLAEELALHVPLETKNKILKKFGEVFTKKVTMSVNESKEWLNSLKLDFEKIDQLKGYNKK
jgi:hypothetical protein